MTARLGIEEMALAHVERHVEFLADFGFLVRVDPRNETVVPVLRYR